jgi:thiosulfate sulfurtransferase
MFSITCDELLHRQRTEEFTLLDVRLREVKEASPLSIARASWNDPERIDAWVDSIARNMPVIVFCAHGRSISQGITKQLNERGFDAHYLEGGLATWIEKGHIIL